MCVSLEHFNALSILVKRKNNARGISFICDTILQYRVYFHCLKNCTSHAVISNCTNQADLLSAWKCSASKELCGSKSKA